MPVCCLSSLDFLTYITINKVPNINYIRDPKMLTSTYIFSAKYFLKNIQTNKTTVKYEDDGNNDIMLDKESANKQAESK